MDIRLIREIGVCRSADTTTIAGSLVRPVALCLAPDESLLIVDARRSGSRLLLLRDKRLQTINVRGLACPTGSIKSIAPMPTGYVVVAGGTPREIALLDDQFEVRARIWSSTDGSRTLNWPSYALPVAEGILVADQAFVARDAGLVLLTTDGSCVWQWRPGPAVLGGPVHLALAADGGTLVTDSQLHRILNLSKPGMLHWQYGRVGHPGSRWGQLSSPMSAVADGDTVVIADTRNHRLVQLNRDGEFEREIECSSVGLGAPMMAIAARGDILVADGDNQRVLRHSRDGSHTVIGRRHPDRHYLSFPRSVQRLSSDSWLIADTNNDRVVIIDAANTVLWEIGRTDSDLQLHWPRAARELPDGRIAIADGLNQRIVIIDRDGATVTEIHELSLELRSIPLSDPHDIRVTSTGSLLVTDARGRFVAEINDRGDVLWWTGDDGCGTLIDPHQAHLVHDCWVDVADPEVGLVRFDRRTGEVTVRRTVVDTAGQVAALDRLKALAPAPIGLFLLNEIPAAHPLLFHDMHGALHRWSSLRSAEHSGESSDMYDLHKPRDIDATSTLLTISDHEAHRLVEIALLPSAGARPVHPPLTSQARS